MKFSLQKKDKALSGKMLCPAPPNTIGASERFRQPATISLTGSSENKGGHIYLFCANGNEKHFHCLIPSLIDSSGCHTKLNFP
jgi:hypothetical protein